MIRFAIKNIPQEADWMGHIQDGEASEEATGHLGKRNGLNKAVELETGKRRPCLEITRKAESTCLFGH